MSYFKYKNTRLYYETYGDQKPILFIHGWGIDHNYFTGCMEPIFQEMEEEYHRFYIDLPGMGLSEPGFVRNGDDIIEVITAFIEQVIGDTSVLLAGNSFGGLLSCGIARKIPERIAGMILVAPAVGIEQRHLPEKVNQIVDENFLSQLTQKQREDFCYMHVVLTKDSWNLFQQYIYPAVLHNDESEFLKHDLDGIISENLFEVEQGTNYKKPVLFITGKQDHCVGYEDQFRLASVYPNSTYVAIQGAGHNVWVDQPVMFNNIIKSWIAENWK